MRNRICFLMISVLLCWPSLSFSRVVITTSIEATTVTIGGTLFTDTNPAATPTSQLKASISKRVSTQIQVGLQKLHGYKDQQDLKQAGYEFMLAYTRGDPQAPAAVAYCTIMGCYGVPDRRSVALWIERARQREPAKAKLLEWANAEQSKDVQLQNRAHSFLRDAISLQDPVALNEQGLLQLSTGQRQQALKSFEAAALRGSAAGARNFNLLLQKINEKTNSSSSTFVSKEFSTDQAIPGQKMYEQAVRYHTGKEVPVNDAQAIELYRQAANMGHLQAKRMIELMMLKLDARGYPDPSWMRLLAQRHLSKNSYEVPSSAIWLQKDISLLADWMVQD